MKLGTEKVSEKVAKVDVKKEAKKAAPKKEAAVEAKKAPKKSMTAFVDALIFNGGSYEELSKLAQKEGDARGLKQKYAEAYFNGHVAFRLNQDKNWLNEHKLKVTKEGITKSK